MDSTTNNQQQQQQTNTQSSSSSTTTSTTTDDQSKNTTTDSTPIINNTSLFVVQLKEQGNTAYKKGDIGVALQAYTKALEICPDDSDQKHLLLCNRATANLALGHTRDAIKDCDESIRICPSFIKAYLRKGIALEEEGRILEALEVVKQGIVELSKDENQQGGAELKRLANKLQGAIKKKANDANKKQNNSTSNKSTNDQDQPVDLTQIDPELYRELQESSENVQILDYELQTKSRQLRTAELTRDYLKDLTKGPDQDINNTLITHVPVGRMFIKRPCSQVLADLDKEIKRNNNDIEAGKQKMKQLEQKVETLRDDLQEMIKGGKRS
jgi:tetratricopeptide (TPR) repeat protein